jgi:NAD(P)-dependent dehydrogenase (short-subunit alcohol dehydrogenase family)
LILHGRDPTRLQVLCQSCEARGARVFTITFDLCDGQTVVRELRAVSECEPIDLVIVGAGVTRMIRDGEEAESFDTARLILAVNLDGALATIAGVLPQMQRRGSGQIALLSSLAAYYGLPRTPAYSASKAALRAYGEALRLWLAPRGIAVNVVLPGFVDTPMTAALTGRKPAMLSAARAAVLIRRGLERNRARIAFPRRLAWGLPWLSVLPAPVSQRIMSAMGFGPRASND